MICAGIDAGSRSIKAVLFDTERGEVLASGLAAQGVAQERLAAVLFEQLLQEAGLDRPRISGIVATGYGRHAIGFAGTTVTEITCHARGVRRLAPEARTIIEIGGQDSKIIRLEDGGRVRDFAMNDRCAAGTGRFLEMVAARLEMNWEKLAELGRQSRKPALISNICAVFAETEIIGLLADGQPLPDVVAGVQNAIATRVAALAGRLVSPPVYFTGGVALLAGMARALEEVLACPVQVAPRPQFTGALGAALAAAAPNPPGGGRLL
ncbi:MAG: acyl-CoA dehydratase activase [Verrucomicrobiota bacterium]|jgi:predicted CoA-substrate-specific enzyme activase